MPQFDVTRFPPQLFWLIVLFIVFTVLMYTVAVPTLNRTIARRQSQLDSDLGRAETLKGEIEAAVAAYEKVLAEARHAAARAMADAQTHIETMTMEREHASKLAIDRQIADAESRIDAARQAAMGDLRGIAIDAASAMTQRILGQDADGSLLAGAVDTALATSKA